MFERWLGFSTFLFKIMLLNDEAFEGKLQWQTFGVHSI